MKRGYIPKPAVTIVTENGDEAAIAQVKQTAEQGVALAQNARAMVMNDRPRIATLEEIAADYPTRVAESAADRAAIHAQIASNETAIARLATDIHDEAENRADADAAHQVAISGLNARIDTIELTPGPQGPQGERGTDGADGAPGVDGKTAYDIARTHGYGGTETQWLASLRGDTGATGTQGAKGDRGETGTAGPTGLTGATGPKGDTGLQGPIGLSGRDANVQIEYRDGINVPAISILNLGTASTEVTITWPTPFPDANYNVTPQLSTTNSALIGRATATVKSKTATSAVITVTTNAIVTLGALVLSAVAIRRT